jgi:capsular polysaccharide biosynthesis protein
MELRAIGRLLLRRWPLIVIPAAIVLIVGLVTYRPPSPAYHAGIRFLISQSPAPLALESDEDNYNTWLESEYIVNSMVDWVGSYRFAVAVSDRLAEAGTSVDPGAIFGSLVADNSRSTLLVSLTHGDPETLPLIFEAVVDVLQEDNTQALPQLGAEPAVVVQLDDPIVNRLPASIASQLDLPFRFALALGVGIGFALLVDYLDPTVRSSNELKKIGLTVLGEIPKS